MGTTQIGKSPAMPPPIWKKPIEPTRRRPSGRAVCEYQPASVIMYSMPVRTVWTFLTLPRMQWAAYMLPSVASSQPGTHMGRFFSQAASIQECRGSI